MIRRTWVQAHARRIPERPAAFIAVHEELNDAYRYDRLMAELREQIEAEVERDLEERA